MSNGGIFEGDVTSVQRMIDDAARRNRKKSTVATGSAMGGFSTTGGASEIVTPPLAPVALSPWFSDELEVANNSSDDIIFGTAVAVDAVTIFYYAVRNSLLVETGFLQIWHDGGVGTFIAETNNGDDAGLTWTVDLVGGLHLTCTADNSGGDTVVKILYAKEGLSAGAAVGFYKATRGSLIEFGEWSVAQDGAAAFDFRTANGDDCGLTFAGSIGTGILSISVAADGSDANDTAVVLTYMIIGAGGTQEWLREGLSVPPSGSASANFESPVDGDVSWDNTLLEVATSDTEIYQFGADAGCVHGWLYCTRKNFMEVSQWRVWRTATGASEMRNLIINGTGAGPGLTLTGVISGSQLSLQVDADGSAPETARVVLAFYKEVTIP